MIFSTFALVLFLRSAFAGDDCSETLAGLLFAQPACVNQLTVDCDSDETLFDVLDPATICPTSCPALFTSTFDTLEGMGCCSSTSLYTSSQNCPTDTELSYSGLSSAIDYFCSSVDYLGADYYCFSDAKDYVSDTTVQTSLITMGQMLLAGNAVGAINYYNGATNAFNCTEFQAAECCYPSLVEFATACGTETQQEQAAQLSTLDTAAQGVCQVVAGILIDTTSICPGLPEITTQTCLAANDANCASDDDAAFGIAPSMTALFATILAVAYLARKH